MEHTVTHPRKQAGFTLVEIAIVLVIVGLLLGAVLKGQELIFNSKVKATFNMSKEFAAAMNGYQDRYKKTAGDDNQAAGRFPNDNPVPINGNGDGQIAWQVWPCVPASGGENCQVFRHLRSAGFISGNAAESPELPFGGRVAIAPPNVWLAALGPALSMITTGITNTHKIMQAVDIGFDDGNPTRGVVRCSAITEYNMATPDVAFPGVCAITF
jgi:prepilin-type N-terminal cleavage/methylation domain-containing protein